MTRTVKASLLYLFSAVLIFLNPTFINAGNGEISYNNFSEKPDPDELIKFMEREKYDDRTNEPSDPLLKVLFKYSPDAYFIVTRTGDYLKGDIKAGNFYLYKKSNSGISGRIITINPDGTKTEKIITEKGWKRYIETEKPFIDQVNQLATAVHEENHGFASQDSLCFLSRKIKSINEIMIPKGDGEKFILLNFKSFYLNKHRTIYAVTRRQDNSIYSAFPAGRLMQFFPEDKITFRYRTYIDKSFYQSTQVTGISGFLDEYNSYYWSNKVIYDLYDYYKQEQPQTGDSW